MQIAADTVVSFEYTLRNNAGEELDRSQDGQPLVYLHGHENIVPGLEKALTGHEAGDKLDVTVAPEEAYGEYQEALVQKVPRDAFSGVEELEPGMSFQAQSNAGPLLVTVKSIDGDEVTVDGNHMLAGEELNFAVQITDVRAATADEVEHGHVHDGDDH